MDLLDGKLVIGTRKSKSMCGYVNDTTMCHHATKIHRFAAGMKLDAQCSTIAAIRIESLEMSELQTDASSALFGSWSHTSVSRAVGEFHGRRPVLFAATDEAVLALPVEGLDRQRRSGRIAVEGRLPRGIGVERLRDAPAEWSRQFEALGLNPQ
jgi:hypothetical protein